MRAAGTSVIAILFCMPMLWSQMEVMGPDHGFDEALARVLGPTTDVVQYNYAMTAKVRLLLFWVGADDVGGGYIRRSKSTRDPESRVIQVLFGSDPSKAPRRINHWGAATEAHHDQFSAVLGFMKSANTASASQAEAETKNQTRRGQYAFEAILSITGHTTAFSRVVRMTSTTDFSMHDLATAQALALASIKSERAVRGLLATDLKCDKARGFLQAVDELSQRAVAGDHRPATLCYVYNARNYSLTMQQVSKVAAKTIRYQRKNGPRVEYAHRDLVDARFVVLNHQSGERTSFQLVLGTVGKNRGVPVQIIHQPNWWFQVILNLDPAYAGRV